MAEIDADDGAGGPYTFTLPDGSTLASPGTYTGKASVQYTNGDLYEGDYVDGKKEGKGVYIYRNGDKFEGQYKDNRRTGLGRIDYSDGGFYHGKPLKLSPT